jgi:hypothetical protein
MKLPVLTTAGLLLSLTLTVAGSGEAETAQPPPGRLIAKCWNMPTPARFRAEVADFEKWGIFAGTTLAPTRRMPDGAHRDCRNAFSREHWERGEFTEALADLQAARPVTATNNFLLIFSNPGDVDWFDDDGWREIVDHWRHLAWLAKQGGLRGLVFDAEPYTKPHAQYQYAAQPRRDQHTLEEYLAQARRRGQEVMRAVAAEFPDATIFTYRLLYDALPLVGGGSPGLVIECDWFRLLPAFVDGWLDAAPPTLVFLEGNEDAYYYRRPEQFDRAFVQMKRDAPRLISPENRAKYRAQARMTHGLFLDAYDLPPDSRYHLPPLLGSRAARLEANVAAALRASEDFVWLHGEKGRWWPGGNSPYPLWPERIPGADRALRRAADPLQAARTALAAADSTNNLLLNASFEDLGPAGVPAQWRKAVSQDGSKVFAQRDHGPGVVTVTNAPATRHRLVRLANGALTQSVPVRPGECLAVSVRARAFGRGLPALLVRWQSPDATWTAPEQTLALSPPTLEQWSELTALVRVPESAGRAVLLLGAYLQHGPEDFAQFAEPRLIRLSQYGLGPDEMQPAP